MKPILYIHIISLTLFIVSSCKSYETLTSLNKPELYNVGNIEGGYIINMEKIEKANKWHSVQFRYFNRIDVTTVCKPIFKDNDKKKYIEINKNSYYFEWEEAPILYKTGIETDISCDLQQIVYDSSKINYGNPPMSVLHRISIVLLIDSTGNLNHYGFYQPSVYGFYEREALTILEQYAFKKSFKPAKVNGKAVGSIYRITCRILPNEKSEFTFGWLLQETPLNVKFSKYNCSNFKIFQ